jgi:hypothetical protein
LKADSFAVKEHPHRAVADANPAICQFGHQLTQGDALVGNPPQQPLALRGKPRDVPGTHGLWGRTACLTEAL